MNAALRVTVIVLLGYIAAVLATPFLVLTFQTAIAAANGGPPPSNWHDLPSFVVMGVMITGMYAAAPFLGAVALMSYFRRRDWLTHGVAGMVVSYIALSLFSGNLVPLALGQVPFLVTGFVVGVLYWLCRRPFGWSWA